MRNRVAKWVARRLPNRVAFYVVVRMATRLERLRLAAAGQPHAADDVIAGLERRTVGSLLDQMCGGRGCG